MEIKDVFQESHYLSKGSNQASPEITQRVHNILKEAGFEIDVNVVHDPSIPCGQAYLAGYLPPYSLVIGGNTPECLEETRFPIYVHAEYALNNYPLVKPAVQSGSLGVGLSILFSKLFSLKNPLSVPRGPWILVPLLSVTSLLIGEKVDDKVQERVELSIAKKLLEQNKLPIVLREILRSQEEKSYHNAKTRYLRDYNLKNFLIEEGINFEEELYSLWKARKRAAWEQNNVTALEQVAMLVDEIKTLSYPFETDYDDQMRVDYQERYEQQILFAYNFLCEMTGMKPAVSFKEITKLFELGFKIPEPAA